MNPKVIKILLAIRHATLLLVILPAAVQAQFTYSASDGSVTITGYTGSGGAVSIPSKIDGLPVTSIGLQAFESNSSISSVVIPTSVTSIQEYAFVGCGGLRQVVIPGSVVSGIGITSIGYAAFGDCNSLSSLTIGNGVGSIGEYAFESCPSLTSVTIPGSVMSIGEDAFAYCTSLTSVTIPGNVTSIPLGAFFDCTSLSSVTIGNGISAIGSGAFIGCADLSTITFPASVTSIGEYAFADCSSLTSAYFNGNAPSADSTVFSLVNESLTIIGYENVTIYHLAGTSGWGATFAGLTTATNSSGVAHSTTTLNIALTATLQLPGKTSGVNNSITTSTTTSATFNSASILKLIATSSGTPFSSGSYLAQNGGNVEALNKAGETRSLSAYFTISNSTASMVFSGTANSLTGQESASGKVYTIFQFNDGKGNAFTVDGLMSETVSLTAENAEGIQTETAEFSGSVVGYGTVVDTQGNTDAAVFLGAISGSGKGPAGQ
jgi:hypothetical protein